MIYMHREKRGGESYEVKYIVYGARGGRIG